MIETVDGSALYVHSAKQVNQMCTKSHFFPLSPRLTGLADDAIAASHAGDREVILPVTGPVAKRVPGR